MLLGSEQSNIQGMHKFDFHSHSLVSDGTFTPTEVVESAAANGVELLALTDHDNIGGVSEAMVAESGSDCRFYPPLKWITNGGMSCILSDWT